MQQHPMDDEEQVSAPGEGDEIMEEPEEQEDGYSEFILQAPSFPPTPSVVTFFPSPAADDEFLRSVFNAYIYVDLDQLVLFSAWP